MNDIILANLLFQAGAATTLMLVAGISAARQLHARRVARPHAVIAQETRTVIELPAARVVRLAPHANVEARSEAA